MTTASDFHDFARWCDDTSPLYARLSRGVAGDDDLLAVADAVADDQPAPNNLFAAVHALLLDGSSHELREFYPSVVGVDGDDGVAADAPYDPAERDPVPAFRDFVLAHEARIRNLVATRRTQTNAVGRCSVLYPAFARVTGSVDGPVSFVEVGASAGLNLLFDRYRYSYGTPDGVVDVGAADSPVHLECRLRGGDPPHPADPPAVGSRVGIDVNPLDVTDASDVNWLRALVWPEHTARHDRLEAALTVARSDPPRLVAGDALDVLPTVVDALPADHAVCVYDTQVRYQLTETERTRYRELLADLSTDRDLHWVSGNDAVEDEGDPALSLDHAHVSSDGPTPTTVARYESHGRWLRWVA
ncbi:DUF2332 domain-containing protein [Haloarchaeobius sp. HRN-SO-5]|uniref:DUF2332 domain-containing protein n=1 Tax=Haloarchaeobius sp. HRN-SO-5 TaxID=3446118 RepID=UPI003EBE577E